MDGFVSIVGIVVGEYSPGKYYVWANETYPGSDGTLTVDAQKPVRIGDWVLMKFSIQDANRYFPRIKDHRTPKFLVSTYSVIPQTYTTEVDGASVRVKLEQYSEENQKEVDHHLFGKIYNNHNLRSLAGLRYLTIRRVAPREYMESVWVLETVDLVPEDPGNGKLRLTGIVSGSDSNYFYVWTKERPIGKDIIIRKSSRNTVLGTWMSLIVPEDQLADHFLECRNYTIIPPLHPTTGRNSTISLRLECRIPEGAENFSHPFVGGIINHGTPVGRAGSYMVDVIRRKPAIRNGVESVWFLTGDPVPLDVEEQAHIPIVPFATEAMVIGMPLDQTVRVWMLRDHEETVVHLNNNDEWARPGTVFSGRFETTNNQIWESDGANYRVERHQICWEYQEGKFDFRITVDAIPNGPDAAHFHFSWIHHEDFGDIIDNRNQLSQGELVRDVWIRRVLVLDSPRWVIVKQCLADEESLC